MGDRCQVTIRAATKDWHHLKVALGDIIGESPKQLFYEEAQMADGTTIGSAEECNYGWVKELEKLHEADIPFEAGCTSGSEYGPCAAVSIDGQHAAVPTLEENIPMIPVEKDGQVNNEALSNARHYLELMKMFESYVKGRQKNDS